MTKFFKNNSKKAITEQAAEPRDMKVIEQEYSIAIQKAGQLQYQIEIYKRELDMHNERLMSLNNEAAERSKLDNAAKEQETKEATNG